MTTEEVKIVAVVNLHREGELARPSILSALTAIEHARRNSFAASLLTVLDRADTETLDVVRELEKAHRFEIREVNFGDLSSSRNYAIEQTACSYVGFLDGDDLWSENWLTESARFCIDQGKTSICHPNWNVIFGSANRHFVHMDQTSRFYSTRNLRFENSWTALSFAAHEVYRAVPYRPNRIQDGFGYEDWSWNCETIAAGYQHRVVPETTHFIRYKKTDSLRMETKRRSCLMSPSSLFLAKEGLPDQDH